MSTLFEKNFRILLPQLLTHHCPVLCAVFGGGDAVQTAEGFGFIDSAIIDQHFIIRKRQNRLISLVLERRMKGVGIDEATAIIVKPDGSFRVAGQSQVMVFEPEAQPTISPTGYLKTNSLNVRILTAGDTYQL